MERDDMRRDGIFQEERYDIGEGRVRWGGWVRRGGGLVEKTTKAAMLIFWLRHFMMLPDKPQYEQTQSFLLFSA